MLIMDYRSSRLSTSSSPQDDPLPAAQFDQFKSSELYFQQVNLTYSPHSTEGIVNLPYLLGDAIYPTEALSPDSLNQQNNLNEIQDTINHTIISQPPSPAWLGYEPFAQPVYQPTETDSLSCPHNGFLDAGEYLSSANVTQLPLRQQIYFSSSNGKRKSSTETLAATQSKLPSLCASQTPTSRDKCHSNNPHQPKRFRGMPGTLVTVFDASTKPHIKRTTRKSYSDEARKKVEGVRRLGACIQCKFRKRTCGTGSPCNSCTNRSPDSAVAKQICIRESPFEDFSATEFYGSSCRTRVVDFEAKVPDMGGIRSTITIGGRGLTQPLELDIVRLRTPLLNSEALERVEKVYSIYSRYRTPTITGTSQPEFVTLLDPVEAIDTGLEVFALNYASDCSQNRNPLSACLTFATEYARRGLAHSTLMGNATKLVALDMVLNHGVQISSERVGTDQRILKAQIDSAVFRCLQRVEQAVYHDLQQLIFKTSGQLARDAIIPVSLAIWLLLRLQCYRAAFMSNMRPRDSKDPVLSTNDKATTSAEHQDHTLNLILGTCSALFRTSFPLFIDFEDKFNGDLIGNDRKMVKYGQRMQSCLRTYKKYGAPRCQRRTYGYSKERSKRLLSVLNEG
ncbi:hypothetical protein BGZ60DRAFT_409296 [Tricladium varicosporioides]|nr:hypothetical protein BGZ60DRAFT_409296 [Hymenoscyphus varicosporioides]